MFWGKERWLKEAHAQPFTPVDPWNEACIDGAGYQLTVGSEYFVNGDKNSLAKKLQDKDSFVILPGQFAYILTGETVRIPKNAIGFITIRASVKMHGLVNVSGFQVNSGHAGKLVFAVFNAGPRPVHMRQGIHTFSLWIADLDTEAGASNSTGSLPNDMTSIPLNVINGIAGESLTAYQLDEKFKVLSNRLTQLENLKAYTLVFLGALGAISLAFAPTIFPKVSEAWAGLFTAVPSEKTSKDPDSRLNSLMSCQEVVSDPCENR
jgi:dCTP deaminase